jgi:hypothetical protein
MARSRLVKTNYYEFIDALRRATDAGHRIEKSDTVQWNQYVKEHGINEIAAIAVAGQTYASVIPVILAEGRDTDGLYLYSVDDEGCLRLISIG